MRTSFSLSFIAFSASVLGHGSHEASGPAKGETIQQYAQRHMSSEHHIDSFDLRSFFMLHDLNNDGFWDKEEIEAIYGVHHVYSQKKSKDDIEHQTKAEHIVKTILDKLDTDKDGKVSPEEFEAVGLDGLPNFDHMGAEGHHYDVESEFFLHHEEQFHSTPETQTDESYNHPEDLEHFAQHEAIERKEAEREAKYQGITVEEAIEQHRLAEEAHNAQNNPNAHDDESQKVLLNDPIAAHPHDEQVTPQTPVASPPKAKVTRVTPPEKEDPKVRFRNARAEAEKKGEWGSGDGGYKPPVAPADKMRKNMPYKYKFRRNWGDF